MSFLKNILAKKNPSAADRRFPSKLSLRETEYKDWKGTKIKVLFDVLPSQDSVMIDIENGQCYFCMAFPGQGGAGYWYSIESITKERVVELAHAEVQKDLSFLREDMRGEIKKEHVCIYAQLKDLSEHNWKEVLANKGEHPSVTRYRKMREAGFVDDGAVDWAMNQYV